jgi:hypothetical protein
MVLGKRKRRWVLNADAYAQARKSKPVDHVDAERRVRVNDEK